MDFKKHSNNKTPSRRPYSTTTTTSTMKRRQQQQQKKKRSKKIATKRSEIDRLLSDEGTRNLLNGIKVIKTKTKTLRIVTRRNGIIPHKNNNTENEKIITTTTTKKSSILLSDNKCAGKSAQAAVTSNFPVLATLVRGHVAFITVNYCKSTGRGEEREGVLSVKDLHSLTRKLLDYESRRGISVIVLNSSSDRVFCDGVVDSDPQSSSDTHQQDLNNNSKKNTSKGTSPLLRSSSIRTLLNTLSQSKKLLIASVNSGRVSGFGLTLLGLFDLVYATDKATFSMGKFQSQEDLSLMYGVYSGGVNNHLIKSMLYTGKAYTAQELHEKGFLITEVLWDGKYHEQLAGKIGGLRNLQCKNSSSFLTANNVTNKSLGNINSVAKTDCDTFN